MSALTFGRFGQGVWRFEDYFWVDDPKLSDQQFFSELISGNNSHG